MFQYAYVSKQTNTDYADMSNHIMCSTFPAKHTVIQLYGRYTIPLKIACVFTIHTSENGGGETGRNTI